MAAGTVSIGALAAGASSGAITVTFPSGRFTLAPRVTVSNVESDYATNCPYLPSATGFSFYSRNVYSINSGATSGHWVAIQMTSGAASG
jgi:hypothetical protein